MADLVAIRERVEEADAIARRLVENDLNADAVPGLNKLRRQARALYRRIE